MAEQIVSIEVGPNHLLPLRASLLVADHVAKGRVAILPTETGYMVAADALNLSAVEHVFELKGRSEMNPIHVVVPSISAAHDLVEIPIDAHRLMELLLPGPLTVICPKKEIVSDLLVANTGNLGIRIPDSPATIALAYASGRPLTATSLNQSGEPTPASLEEGLASLAWSDGELVYVVRDDSLAMAREPSTVVTFADQPWRILREGPITSDQIASAVANLSFQEFGDWA